MSKKYGFSPFVFLLDVGEGDDVSGNGSGQSGVKPFPCDFDHWLTTFKKDYNNDGAYEWTDYEQWWLDNSFTFEAWKEINPGVPFPGDGGSDPAPIPGDGGESGGDAVSDAISEMMGDIPG